MPYTVDAKNLMLNALKGTNPTTPITHAGLFDSQTAITGVTGEADDETFAKTAHGLSNGDLVVLSGLTGGAGLVVGRAYFVIGAAANAFQLSEQPGGSAAAFTTDVTAATVTELVELTGGAPAYARKAIAFNAAVAGSMDDSTNGAVFDVPAGASVDYGGLFSADTAGLLLVVDDVPSEVFASQGTYTMTDADLDLNAA